MAELFHLKWQKMSIELDWLISQSNSTTLISVQEM